MVKTVSESSTSSDANRYGITKPGERNSDSCKYKGVRKRKWGKWVSEIRLPNSRERIWLGSYDSPVKAARAFDAALFCLRGPTAKFNFPDNPPDIPGGRSLAPSQIQAAAAQFANSGHSDHSSWSSSGSDELQQSDSPCPSGSDGATHINNEMTLNNSILDEFACMGSGNNNNNNNTNTNTNTNTNNNNNVVPDFGIFPGFDDFPNEYFILPQLPGTVDYGLEEAPDDEFTSQGSFLWNF